MSIDSKFMNLFMKATEKAAIGASKFIGKKWKLKHLDSGILYRRLTQILLNNRIDLNDVDQIKKAIKLVNRKKTTIEVSGNISLRNIHSFKDLKIDYISIGDLTKNIESVDFSMLIEN